MDLKNKIICLDIDGTIARNDSYPSLNTINYLNSLKEQGYLICIVTGRQWISSYKIYNALKLDSICVLCNGALVYNPKTNTKIVDIQIDRNDIFNLIRNENLMKYIDDMMCEIDMTTYSLTGNFNWNENQIVGSFEENLKANPNSYNIRAKSFDVQEKIKSEIVKTNKYNYRFWYLQGEMYLNNLNKKNGVIELLHYYNKKQSDLLYIGDGHNDIELLDFANISVAMKNAPEDVKKHAKYITTFDNENDGAIKFLKELIEN